MSHYWYSAILWFREGDNEAIAFSESTDFREWSVRTLEGLAIEISGSSEMIRRLNSPLIYQSRMTRICGTPGRSKAWRTLLVEVGNEQPSVGCQRDANNEVFGVSGWSMLNRNRGDGARAMLDASLGVEVGAYSPR